jgi:hypothetical protein
MLLLPERNTLLHTNTPATSAQPRQRTASLPRCTYSRPVSSSTHGGMSPEKPLYETSTTLSVHTTRHNDTWGVNTRPGQQGDAPPKPAPKEQQLANAQRHGAVHRVALHDKVPAHNRQHAHVTPTHAHGSHAPRAGTHSSSCRASILDGSVPAMLLFEMSRCLRRKQHAPSHNPPQSDRQQQRQARRHAP